MKYFILILFFPILLYGQRASLPYSTGFDNTDDYSYWESGFIEGEGDLCIGCNRIYIAHCCLNGYGIGYADLNMDLTNSNNVKMDFIWKYISFYKPSGCWSEAVAEANSGIYLSDDNGTSFQKIMTIEDMSTPSWISVSLDINDLASTYGLELNNQFVIRFQAYTYYSYSPNCLRDIEFDDLNVFEDCPSNITIDTDIGTGEIEYLASNSITATNIISNGAEVHYGANSSVKMQTGFKVNQNCSFIADLEGCTSVSSKNLNSQNTTVSEVQIYPNPSNGIFKIDNLEPNSSKKIKILDQSGRIVFDKIIESNSVNLDLQYLKKGIYFIQIDTSKGMSFNKVIIY